MFDFQDMFYSLKRAHDIRRKDVESKKIYVQRTKEDGQIDFQRALDWGMKPVLASVKPVQEHLIRTNAKFLIDLDVLQKQIEAIISTQRNKVLARMWDSILHILQQSEEGIAACRNVTRPNMAAIKYHVLNITAI